MDESLPYTYTAPDGRLTVTGTRIIADEGTNRSSVAVPTGDHAIDLAEAVLTVGGLGARYTVASLPSMAEAKRVDSGVIAKLQGELDAAQSTIRQLRQQRADLRAGQGDSDACCGGQCSNVDGPLDDEELRRRADRDEQVGAGARKAALLEGANVVRAMADDRENPLVRLAALEDLIADQADALERQSRDIDDLRSAMGNAQAALNGLAQRDAEIQVNVSALGADHADLKDAYKAFHQAHGYSAGEDG